jgi:type VI secretion system protein ImpL
MLSMSALLELLKKLPIALAGLVAAVLMGTAAIAVVGSKIGWWQTLERTLGRWFWLGLLLLLVVSLLVVLLWLVPWYRKRRFLAQLASEDAKIPQDEVKERHRRLQAKIQEAIRTLQKNGRRLYDPPWYLLLGASQSGKTALLQGVAQHFSPFARPEAAVRGPTQDCDWWFFSTAIILDTSGYYAFPTEGERDGTRWDRFLQLLRYYRELRPINGLIVTIAADVLVSRDEEALQRDAVELRKRVDVAIQKLGIHFPVFLLVTRCDLLEGFTEFFARLPEHTWRQVFGYRHTAQPLTDDQPSDATAAFAFETVFASLVERLQEIRLSLFNEERVPPISLHQKLFCFPEEFRALQQPLKTFITTFLLPHPSLRHTPFLRGLFFCSAQQQGVPVSFLRRELHFDGPRRALEGGTRTYFLHDFFNVILKEDQYLVRPTREKKRDTWLRHLLGLSSCVAFCLLLLVFLSRAYQSDQDILSGLDAGRCEVAAGQQGTGLPLPQVDSCRQEVESLQQKNHQRPSWSKLLFNSSGKQERRLRQRYAALFEAELLTPLDTRIAAQLSNGSQTIPLVFLLLTRLELLHHCLSPTGCPDPIAPDEQPDYQLMLDPVLQRPPSSEQVTMLRQTYEAYLRWSSDTPERLRQEQEAHAERLQRWFASKQFALSQLLPWINQQYTPVTLQTFWEGLPPTSDGKTVRVEAAYTSTAWQKKLRPFLQRASEAVPGMESSMKEFQEVYRTEYFAQWQRFLADFPRGEQPWLKTRAQRRQLALKLLETGSPYTRVIDSALEHLQPFLPIGANAAVAAAAVSSQMPAVTEPPLPSWLRVLRDYADSENRKAYTELLKQVGTQFGPEVPREKRLQLAQSGFQEGAPTEKSSQPVLKAWWIVKQLQEKAGTNEATVVWPLLERPVLLVWKVLLEDAAESLQQNWTDTVVLPTKDLPQMEQIETLYGPQGKVREFVDRSVKPFLTDNETRFGKLLGEEVPLKPEFLDVLRTIRDLSPLVGGVYQARVQALKESETDSRSDTFLKKKTGFQLDCAAKSYEIKDATEASEKTVLWSSKTCGDVVITFSLSCDKRCVDQASMVGMSVLENSISWSKPYPGQNGFLRFVQDFSNGKKDFGSNDFADSTAAKLRPYEVKTIHVYYRVDAPTLTKIISLPPSAILPQTIMKD